jgi:bacteriocin-like protein
MVGLGPPAGELEGEAMSQIDYQRLVSELRDDPGALQEAAGLTGSAQSLMNWAAAKGYELTSMEAERLLENFQELSDDELDKVAGGEDAWGSGGSTPPPTGP